MKRNIHRLSRICALGLAVLLCACAGISPTPSAEDEAALRRRAEAYWRLRVDHDFLDSYAYETPKYRRKYKVKYYYSSLSNSATTAAKVGPIFIEGDYAAVEVTTTFYFPLMPERHRARTDYWQKVDGEWYHWLGKPKNLRRGFGKQ